MANKVSLLAVLVVVGLFVGACGGQQATTAVPSAAPAAATTEAPDEAPAAATEAPATEAVTEAPAATADAAVATAEATTESAASTTGTTEAAQTAATAAAAATVASTGQAERYVLVPDQSRVAYNVGETFLNQGNRYVVAVGVTNVLTGEVLFDRANPSNSQLGTISIDISQFTSDSERRDNAIRREWLESSQFPIAEFTITKIDGLPATYSDGQEVTLQISGDLKVRDAIRPTTFETTGKIEGDTMTGRATSQVKMTDFGFDPPSILGILNAEDDVQIEFDFVAQRQPA